jgi:WD40 repeat protein
LDDPDEYEAIPIRVLNGNGTLITKAHEGDICTVDFHEPNWLATGSADGVIVIWNLDTNSIRFIMKEPFIKQRSQEERAVEKVVFILNQSKGHFFLT